MQHEARVVKGQITSKISYMLCTCPTSWIGAAARRTKYSADMWYYCKEQRGRMRTLHATRISLEISGHGMDHAAPSLHLYTTQK